MFNKKKQPPIRSLIAQGSLIEGNFKFSEGRYMKPDIFISWIYFFLKYFKRIFSSFKEQICFR